MSDAQPDRKKVAELAHKDILEHFDKSASPLNSETRRIFDRVFDMTIRPAIEKQGRDWSGSDREWILKQVEKIARKAQAKSQGEALDVTALRSAVNEQVPKAKVACARRERIDPEDDAAADESFGGFCLAYVPV